MSGCYFFGQWGVAKGVIFFLIFSGSGIIGPSMFSILAETVSSTIMIFSYALINLVFFIVNAFYPFVMKKTDDGEIYMYGFIILAILAAIGAVLIWLFVAETGGQTKKQIYERIFWKKQTKESLRINQVAQM